MRAWSGNSDSECSRSLTRNHDMERAAKCILYRQIPMGRPPAILYGGEAGGPGYVVIGNYYEQYITDVVVGPDML